MNLMPHNERAYMEIVQSLKDHKSVIYVSGVGTGKSFVFMAVAECDFTGRILYVIPKHSIRNNMKTYNDFTSVADRVDFVTFNAFNNKEKGLALVSDHDLVVIDECHHLGSDRYGKCLLSCLAEADAKVLGLTATPVREKDRFDVSEYFDVRVDGLSNFEAIRQGLMPEIEYRLCLPEQDLRQIEREYDYTARAVLSFEDSETVLAGAVKAFPRDKWICFFPDVKAIGAYRSLVERIFPDYEVMELYATLGNLDEVIDRLGKAEKAVVLSCNILLEGVHLDGVDGIILFRNVTSLPAFQQMIGRVCSIGKKISPVVLDGSSCALKLMAKLMSDGNGKPVPDGDGGAKDIVRVGIGEHKHYDLQKLLMAVDKNARKEYLADMALEKYRSFKGRMYSSLSALANSKIDMDKLKACCRLYGVSVRYTMERMVAA